MDPLRALLFLLIVVAIVLAAAYIAAATDSSRRRKSCYSPSRHVHGGAAASPAPVQNKLFRFKIGEPQYKMLHSGTATAELRFDVPPYNRLAVGAEVMVVRVRGPDDAELPDGTYRFLTTIDKIDRYADFAAVPATAVKKVFPSLSAEAAKAQFMKFAPKNLQAGTGVLCFTFSKPRPAPPPKPFVPRNQQTRSIDWSRLPEAVNYRVADADAQQPVNRRPPGEWYGYEGPSRDYGDYSAVNSTSYGDDYDGEYDSFDNTRGGIEGADDYTGDDYGNYAGADDDEYEQDNVERVIQSNEYGGSSRRRRPVSRY